MVESGTAVLEKRYKNFKVINGVHYLVKAMAVEQSIRSFTLHAENLVVRIPAKTDLSR